MRTNTNNRGFMLIEMIFYVCILVVLTAAIINSFVTMSRVSREVSIQGELMHVTWIMELISREVRHAYDIAAILPTDITLNTRDESGAPQTVRFYFDTLSPQLYIYRNSINIGQLSSYNIQITGISFTQITTAEGKAVKFNLTARHLLDSALRIKTYNNTVVLRGGYE